MNEWTQKSGWSDRIAQKLVRGFALGFGRIVYRVRVVGELPAQGGLVMVCNHVSYADTIPLSLATKRRLRFTSFEGLFSWPVLGPCLKAFGSIPVSATNARETIRRAADCAKSGETVLLFPEGQLTLDGELQEIKGGFELIARRSKCPMVMVHIDGLWGSIFSFERGKWVFKWPRKFRRDITVTFSKPVAADAIDVATVERFWRTHRCLDQTSEIERPALSEALS